LSQIGEYLLSTRSVGTLLANVLRVGGEPSRERDVKEKSTTNTVRTNLVLDDRTAADLYVELNGGNLKAAAEILMRALAPSMSIRKARDRFTSVLRSVRNGKIQLVGSDPGEQVIMINVRELVAVIARLNNAPSFRGCTFNLSWTSVRNHRQTSAGSLSCGPLPTPARCLNKHSATCIGTKRGHKLVNVTIRNLKSA
jgi:hypothetical protein